MVKARSTVIFRVINNMAIMDDSGSSSESFSVLYIQKKIVMFVRFPPFKRYSLVNLPPIRLCLCHPPKINRNRQHFHLI